MGGPNNESLAGAGVAGAGANGAGTTGAAGATGATGNGSAPRFVELAGIVVTSLPATCTVSIAPFCWMSFTGVPGGSLIFPNFA